MDGIDDERVTLVMSISLILSRLFQSETDPLLAEAYFAVSLPFASFAFFFGLLRPGGRVFNLILFIQFILSKKTLWLRLCCAR
jgi:hypothetical protein